MTADEILKMQAREAYAAGVKAFGRHFGNVLAALIVGVALGLFAAWAAWLFYFAAVETWTVLVSPLFMAAAEGLALIGLWVIWRLLRPRGGGDEQ